MTTAAERRRDITALFMHAHTCPTGCTDGQEDAGVTAADYQAADSLLAVLDGLGNWTWVES
jgi:hypothetical protein